MVPVMKVFAEAIPPHGEYLNETVFSAVQGFRDKGFEVQKFEHGTDLLTRVPSLESCLSEVSMETPVVGSISAVRFALQQGFGVSPAFPTYPQEARRFLGRNVREATVGEVMRDPSRLLGKFVKPQEQKLFTGKVMGTIRDLVTLGQLPDATKVFVADAVNFVLEVRCFVLDGDVIGTRPYRGDLIRSGVSVNDSRLGDILRALRGSAPRAYCIDLGVTKEYVTLLVECNDGFALGHYGLPRHLYTDLIEARWLELTSSKGKSHSTLSEPCQLQGDVVE